MLIAVDFDGTIADTSLGILDSHRYALEAVGDYIPSEDELRNVIGGNLLLTYINTFDFKEEKARIAVKIYRERYAKVGIHKAILYPGVLDLLQRLKEENVLIGIATLKADRFAKSMLEELGIAHFFDVVCGMDDHDAMTKADLIKKCCVECGITKKDAVLVGDSNNDFLGAMEAGVEFIGVTYGFGFIPYQQYDFLSANTIDEIYELLCE